MYAVTVFYELESVHQTQFTDRARALSADALVNDPHCRRFDVCVHPDAPERVMFYQLFDDGGGFLAYLNSERFIRFDVETQPWVVTKWIRPYDLMPPL
ncbi:MAG: antibiotic biosynthesis monooxygenase [Rhodobacteraceae bacterium]|nr:antibiotic biosynthesis monooxygenase [Paracoccaceae bacterium]